MFKHLIPGDYGKLGHGNSSTQKYPKLMQGVLTGKVIVFMNPGFYIKSDDSLKFGSFLEIIKM